MSFSELFLTDGETRIDLMGANRRGSGFVLVNYVMGRPGFKGGGVWQDSPLAVGRQLAATTRMNISEALTLRIAYGLPQNVIQAFEDLDGLIEKAIAYWTTTWQQEPVYLQARAKGESSRRYALVHMAHYDSYFNPHGQAFLGVRRSTTDEFVLGIERGPWLEFVPGLSEPVAISHAGSLPASSTDPDLDTLTFTVNVFIGNMQNAGLKAIYVFTGGSSGNLLAGSPPYALFATPPATGNTTYFGADQPFYGLVTDLSSLTDASVTLAYEFWNGAAWVPITVLFSGPVAFGTVGIGSLRWLPSSVSTWAKTTVNGENRYWIQIRVVAASGGTTTYTQANRHIYAATNAYIEVAEDEVGGTLDALMRTYLQRYNVDTTDQIEFWAGLRSYERGSSFVAHINFGNLSGNPAGIIVTGTLAGTNGHTNAVTANFAHPTAPGGESASLVGATGDTLGTAIYVNFGGSTAYRSFYGRFRLFVLLNTDDNTGASRLRYSVNNYTATAEYARGEIKSVATTPTSYQLVDLGNVTLPAADTLLLTEDTYGFRLNIEALVTNLKTLTFLSIILMPADECLLQVSGKIPSVTADSLSVIHVDGIGYPKHKVRAFSMEGDPYVVTSGPLTVSSSEPPILHAGTRQRWWFLFRDAQIANPAIATSVKVHKCQRYLGLRGD